MGRQGRTITCNSQLKLSSNEYISFRDLPLLYEKIGGYLNILLSNCCCWIKCQFCISICFKSGTDGRCCVTKGKICVFCLRFCCRAGFLSSNVISVRVIETRVSGYPLSMRFVLNSSLKCCFRGVGFELGVWILRWSPFWPPVGGNSGNACTEIF